MAHKCQICKTHSNEWQLFYLCIYLFQMPSGPEALYRGEWVLVRWSVITLRNKVPSLMVTIFSGKSFQPKWRREVQSRGRPLSCIWAGQDYFAGIIKPRRNITGRVKKWLVEGLAVINFVQKTKAGNVTSRKTVNVKLSFHSKHTGKTWVIRQDETNGLVLDRFK